MPFKKRGKYYYSPSGRKFTKKQVAMYYATKGFKKGLIRGKKKRKKKGNPGSKGIGTVAEREMPFLGLEREANRRARRLRRGRT